MSRYPQAEWIPWGWTPQNPSYYNDQNSPEAVVLHVMEGWGSTVRQWAESGFASASWHFTVLRDGRVWQHLDFNDGGYHAGISQFRYNGKPNPQPTWKLWKGWGVNVNNYTIGIEHEGFSGQRFTDAQENASRELCRWLAQELRIPLDRDHFTYHGDIALIDRANDFNTPELRDEFYAFLMQADEVAVEQSPWLSQEESIMLQAALGEDAIALPQPVTELWQDFTVAPTFKGGERIVPKGTPVDVYHVLVPRRNK